MEACSVIDLGDLLETGFFVGPRTDPFGAVDGAAAEEVVQEPMDDEIYKTCFESYNASLKSSAAWGSRSEGVFTAQRNRVVGI